MAGMQQVANTLRNTPAVQQRLKRQNFTLTNGADGVRSKIASYQAESPVVFREDAVRMMLVNVEQFATDGSGNQQTFDLAGNIIPSGNTNDFLLYEDGARVSADSVDYAGDSFDYTGPGNAAYLHAYYVVRDPAEIEIVKSAPKSQGQVSEVVFDGATSMLHERNQNQDPPDMDFPSAEESPLAPVVPRNWTVDIYADGPVGFDWNDDGTANPQGTTAVNAIVSLPINRAKQQVDGLGQAVKQDIIND